MDKLYVRMGRIFIVAFLILGLVVFLMALQGCGGSSDGDKTPTLFEYRGHKTAD
jgi:hypothetical protein